MECAGCIQVRTIAILNLVHFDYELCTALLMEEEIPTGIYLLRRISKHSLVAAEINYKKFVVSSIVRILLGYTFLVNAFYVIAQGDRVLDIFYDMLALSKSRRRVGLFNAVILLF